MKKRYSLITKTAAFFIFAVTLTAAVLGAGASVYMLEDGYYNAMPTSFAESGLCYRQAQRASEAAFYDYFGTVYEGDGDSGAVKTYEEHFSREKTNFAFRIKYLAGGEPLLDTYKDEDGFTFVTSFSYLSGKYYYTLEAYLDPNLPVKSDGFYSASRTYDWLLRWRYTIPVIAGACALAALAAFIYQISAAGHRYDTAPDVITLTWFDKIPLDLLALGILFAAELTISMGSGSDFYSETLLLVAAAITVVVTLLGMAFCVSFAARVKKGGWYKNTLIYMALHLAWRVVKAVVEGTAKILDNLPAIWKTVVFWGALCFFNMICVISGGFGSFFWWFVVNAAVGVLLCFVSMWMRDLQKGGEAIAHGDLSYHVDTSKMRGDFKCHGEALNNISIGMGRAVDERMKSERFKTELITNVSHDLKTPLTSIINYVDLIKKEDTADQKIREYVAVLDRQSARLKKLTEDLVEASKASSGSISAEPVRMDVIELLNQAASEYEERLAAAGVEAVIHAPEDEISIYADGRLLWRVFDNLLGNICKYSQRGTRAYIDVEESSEDVAIIFKNISNYQLNISADELMERFVRGDTSRHTEGSGLGLSIARSLTELQGGRLSLIVDGDLFKAIVTFGRIYAEPEAGMAGAQEKTEAAQPLPPALPETTM